MMPTVTEEGAALRLSARGEYEITDLKSSVSWKKVHLKVELFGTWIGMARYG